MTFIQVTDDDGATHYLNAQYILDVKRRPGKSELGTVIRFQNGNMISVIEGPFSVLKQINDATPRNYEAFDCDLASDCGA
jgi:uncharacterized protein YlzI (FlbEa/FlbD family)